MIDGTYKIKVDVPFGRKEGKLVLRTEGNTVIAEIDAPIIGKKQMKAHAEGDTFTAQGSDKFKLVGNVDYTLNGKVSGDDLFINVNSNKGEIDLHGVRV